MGHANGRENLGDTSMGNLVKAELPLDGCFMKFR